MANHISDAEAIAQRIDYAKQLLNTAHNAAMATVNADGSPHNTPFYLIHGPRLDSIYWGSSSESLHSQNVVRTGQVFVVLYDAMAGGGLYIDGNGAHELSGHELSRALQIHNQMRQRAGKDVLTQDYYEASSPQRMYRAKVVHLYINSAQRDEDGHIIRDYRHEITADDIALGET